MLRVPKVTIGALGAVALVGALLTNALASGPRPSEPRGHAQAWKYNYHGNVLFNGVVRIAKNNSVYGKLYAHGGEQVWSGLLLNSGNLAITKGNLVVSSASSQSSFAGGVSVGGNLAAGNISGSALSLTGAASIAGAATIGGKLTASGGIDAGSSSITTTGGITAGTLTAANLNLSGTLTTSGGATIGGTLSAGNVNVGGTLTFNNAKVVGTVDFTNANVTGLGGLGGNPTSLTVGSSTATTSPLTISENAKTAIIGVNSAGALTVGSDLAVGGNLSVAGTTGVTASNLTSPVASGGTAPGTLTLTGNPITLAGNTSLSAGSDLTLSHSGSPGGINVTATHILAAGDTDVAGQATVPANSGGPTSMISVQFIKSYAAAPIVTLTPANKPAAGCTYWVSLDQTATPFTSFTVHYDCGTATSTTAIPFNYQVIGS